MSFRRLVRGQQLSQQCVELLKSYIAQASFKLSIFPLLPPVGSQMSMHQACLGLCLTLVSVHMGLRRTVACPTAARPLVER